MRALMFYHERKQHHMNKIKSKVCARLHVYLDPEAVVQSAHRLINFNRFSFFWSFPLSHFVFAFSYLSPGEGGISLYPVQPSAVVLYSRHHKATSKYDHS